ncbi:MAG: polysaccharide deacetylase family protein [Azoarcus sp.]|jgi:peptidoglycan/xylan/chitin deacetylase (PgdA/CDA1 family)|nr:polysaccharide deacetylase family protein [Azoarcus sp.]
MLLKHAMGLASPGGRDGRLSILFFHRVRAVADPLFPEEPDLARFSAWMRWIAEWFRVLPLDRAMADLRAGTLPARAAVLTFDDGYADACTLALPVLRRHGLSAAFFVASGFLDGGQMWNDKLIEAVRRTRREWLETGLAPLPAAPVRTDREKRAFLERLILTVKYLPPRARGKAIARVVDACGVELAGNPMLDTAQVRELRAAGMQIGAHTLEHPLLAVCTDAEAEAEIATGRERLEAVLGERVRFFAYPNGKPGADYTRRHVEMVRRMGFDAALTTCRGVNTRRTDPYQLLRFTPWDRSRGRFGLRMLGNFFHPGGEVFR